MRRARRRTAYKPKPRERVTYRYRRQYGLIIVCKDETHQRSLFEQLGKRGLQCRVVCV